MRYGYNIVNKQNLPYEFAVRQIPSSIEKVGQNPSGKKKNNTI